MIFPASVAHVGGSSAREFHMRSAAPAVALYICRLYAASLFVMAKFLLAAVWGLVTLLHLQLAAAAASAGQPVVLWR